MPGLTRESDKCSRIVQQKGNTEAGAGANDEGRLARITCSRFYGTDLIGLQCGNGQRLGEKVIDHD